MENPVFKLEKVVRSRSEEMQDFEGPLDLILFLLSKNKMEIQDISISLICDQYVAWLEARQKMDLEVASEFVTMASHLVYLKTRMLLSIEDEEAQSEMDELIKSLEDRKNSETYERIKRTVELLGPMSEFGRNIMVKTPEPFEHEKVYLYDHAPEDLLAALHAVADRSERNAPPSLESFSKIVSHEPYPVSMKAGEIMAHLKSLGKATFRMLFRGSRSRSEVVATFLAVLELCKNRMIHLAGSEADCAVTPVGEAGDI